MQVKRERGKTLVIKMLGTSYTNIHMTLPTVIEDWFRLALPPRLHPYRHHVGPYLNKSKRLIDACSNNNRIPMTCHPADSVSESVSQHGSD